jgi:hypothetical protein
MDQKKIAAMKIGGFDPATLFWAVVLTNDSDDEDEAAELMRELEKIKKERLAQKEKEVFTILQLDLVPRLTNTRNANGQQRRKSSARSILRAVTLCSTPRTST